MVVFAKPMFNINIPSIYKIHKRVQKVKKPKKNSISALCKTSEQLRNKKSDRYSIRSIINIKKVNKEGQIKDHQLFSINTLYQRSTLPRQMCFMLSKPESISCRIKTLTGYQTFSRLKAKENKLLFSNIRGFKTFRSENYVGLSPGLKRNRKNEEMSMDDTQNDKVPKQMTYVNVFEQFCLDLAKFIASLAVVVALFELYGFIFDKNSKGEHFKRINSEKISVKFSDVKGATEAKSELEDIVSFLRDPGRYKTIGAKLPKGVLLVGPPGVGKTLLARAVAGEAGVPFFYASGSEFDEVLVGVGARRVRQLFEAAKKTKACIIFIDEIDSIGAKRTTGVNQYTSQTINQLLSEMDGFSQNEGIIVLAATNKVEDIDKALRRPGRFDVEVTLTLPDMLERKEILEYYISKVKTAYNVNADQLAKRTIGFSGAELQNLINQAALKAVLEGKQEVDLNHLEYARDKIMMGPERKWRMLDPETNLTTAYHEAGHTLVAFHTRDAQVLHKVTIIPRGQSLGHTAFVDEKELHNRTVSQLKAMIDTSMGGRAAEEIVFGKEKTTSGASNDLDSATKIASSMIMALGMSDKIGLRTFPENLTISDVQKSKIDEEIKSTLDESYKRAKNILLKHREELNLLANALLKQNTLDKSEIEKLLNKNNPNGKAER